MNVLVLCFAHHRVRAGRDDVRSMQHVLIVSKNILGHYLSKTFFQVILSSVLIISSFGTQLRYYHKEL